MFHNIGILAHVDSGKTTLTEQILYHTGAIRSAGSVDLGTTATDHLTIERERGISVRTSTASTTHRGVTFNLIDTPGHVDFAGEVERSLAALDYAILIVSAVEGVRAHTENLLKALDKANLPALVFINKIDRAGCNIESILSDLSSLTSRTPLLLSHTKGEETAEAKVSLYQNEDFDQSVTEALCDLSEEAEEAFLSDAALSHERAESLLREHIAACQLLPVLCGSAKLSVGVKELLDFMTSYMPSATRRATDSLCGVIFKIEHDKTMGKVSHIRLFGGKITNRDEITLLSPIAETKPEEREENEAVALEEKEAPREKVSQIRKFIGAKYSDAGEVAAGDIAALCGLSSAKSGHFIGSFVQGASPTLATPFLRVQVTPKDSSPEEIPRLAEALMQLSDEEPYINAKWENGQKEIVINTTGRIQVEVIESLLHERYKIAANFSPPTVIYKETPAKAGFAYADYTMPKPCWAVVQFKFEPMPRGYGVSYHGKLPSNQCFYRYQTHIRTSFNRCLEQGLYGWEVTDFKCTLVGGEHHTIHTHPLDFFVCTPMAFMNGMQSLGSTLLEPLLLMRMTAPAELYGKLAGEIIRMGGEHESPVMHGTSITLEAIVPAATSMDFPQKLASLSSGKAVLNTSFYGYRECRDGKEHISPRRGVNPLDRSKWILWARGAYQLSQN